MTDSGVAAAILTVLILPGLAVLALWILGRVGALLMKVIG